MTIPVPISMTHATEALIEPRVELEGGGVGEEQPYRVQVCSR